MRRMISLILKRSSVFVIPVSILSPAFLTFAPLSWANEEAVKVEAENPQKEKEENPREEEKTSWNFRWDKGFKLDSSDGDFKLAFGGRFKNTAELRAGRLTPGRNECAACARRQLAHADRVADDGREPPRQRLRNLRPLC